MLPVVGNTVGCRQCFNVFFVRSLAIASDVSTSSSTKAANDADPESPHFANNCFLLVYSDQRSLICRVKTERAPSPNDLSQPVGVPQFCIP